MIAHGALATGAVASKFAYDTVFQEATTNEQVRADSMWPLGGRTVTHVFFVVMHGQTRQFTYAQVLRWLSFYQLPQSQDWLAAAHSMHADTCQALLLNNTVPSDAAQVRIDYFTSTSQDRVLNMLAPSVTPTSCALCVCTHRYLTP